jgi:glycosyltransferase involved in cell wall biosynthesis
LQKAGWDINVICPSNDKFPEGDFQIEGVSVHRFKSVIEANTPLGYLREYWQSLSRMRKGMKFLARSGSFEVVQFCNPPDLLAVIGLEAKLLYKSKVIFDQHDLGPELVVAKNMSFERVLVKVARLFEFLAYKVADKVIATNESYREIALTRGKKRGSDISVVRSAPSRDWAEASIPISDWRKGHKYQIGYLGVIGQQEGLHFALEALRILRNNHGKDVYFTVVGSGTDLDKMKRYSQDLGIESYVSFLGRLPDAEMQSVLASADVCVNPDVFSVLNNLSTMNKIIEYMALGVPIVQFDLQEGRYSAGEASLYADPDDPISFAQKINTLLESPELRSEMGDYGRQRFAKLLCWENQVEPLLSVYESLRLQKKV